MSEQWKTDLATLKRTQNNFPQFIMGVLAQAKNGDEQFQRYKFHAANGNAQHALKVP